MARIELLERPDWAAALERSLTMAISTDEAVAQLWEDAAHGTLDGEGAPRAQGLRPPPDTSRNGQ